MKFRIALLKYIHGYYITIYSNDVRCMCFYPPTFHRIKEHIVSSAETNYTDETWTSNEWIEGRKELSIIDINHFLR